MNILRTCAAVLLGFVLGVSVYRPTSVKAGSGVHVQQVNGSYVGIIGNRVTGFACTSDTCYVASE
ncbi:MAG: hypothetical protein WBQ43_21470 [Terriglobales bacterium]